MHLLVIEDERALCETIVRTCGGWPTAWTTAMTGKRRWRFWAWNDTIWCFLI